MQIKSFPFPLRFKQNNASNNLLQSMPVPNIVQVQKLFSVTEYRKFENGSKIYCLYLFCGLPFQKRYTNIYYTIKQI